MCCVSWGGGSNGCVDDLLIETVKDEGSNGLKLMRVMKLLCLCSCRKVTLVIGFSRMKGYEQYGKIWSFLFLQVNGG